jgi:serine phosphatase RsbU (regulator of sigma subunit)
MAALRFAVRAYLAEGHDIEAAMARLDGLIDVGTDHQFATVLLGELDATAGRLRVLSAGHLPPLLLTEGNAELIDCPVTPPVGVGAPGARAATVVRVPGPATLLAFTDGLVERRDEVIDTGLARLCDAAAGAQTGSLQALVDELMQQMTVDGGKDDTVLMGLRWTT